MPLDYRALPQPNNGSLRRLDTLTDGYNDHFSHQNNHRSLKHGAQDYGFGGMHALNGSNNPGQFTNALSNHNLNNIKIDAVRNGVKYPEAYQNGRNFQNYQSNSSNNPDHFSHFARLNNGSIDNEFLAESILPYNLVNTSKNAYPDSRNNMPIIVRSSAKSQGQAPLRQYPSPASNHDINTRELDDGYYKTPSNTNNSNDHLVARLTQKTDGPVQAGNTRLATVLVKLAGLARLSGSVFEGLHAQAVDFYGRSISLQARMDRASVALTGLEGSGQDGSSIKTPEDLNDGYIKDLNKNRIDQQVVRKDTMPATLKRLYALCDAPPPLEKLNKFREDGKDAAKLYTDPSYFFDLWKRDMLSSTTDSNNIETKPNIRKPLTSKSLYSADSNCSLPQNNTTYRVYNNSQIRPAGSNEFNNRLDHHSSVNQIPNNSRPDFNFNTEGSADYSQNEPSNVPHMFANDANIYPINFPNSPPNLDYQGSYGLNYNQNLDFGTIDNRKTNTMLYHPSPSKLKISQPFPPIRTSRQFDHPSFPIVSTSPYKYRIGDNNFEFREKQNGTSYSMLRSPDPSQLLPPPDFFLFKEDEYSANGSITGSLSNGIINNFNHVASKPRPNMPPPPLPIPPTPPPPPPPLNVGMTNISDDDPHNNQMLIDSPNENSQEIPSPNYSIDVLDSHATTDYNMAPNGNCIEYYDRVQNSPKNKFRPPITNNFKPVDDVIPSKKVFNEQNKMNDENIPQRNDYNQNVKYLANNGNDVADNISNQKVVEDKIPHHNGVEDDSSIKYADSVEDTGGPEDKTVNHPIVKVIYQNDGQISNLSRVSTTSSVRDDLLSAIRSGIQLKKMNSNSNIFTSYSSSSNPPSFLPNSLNSAHNCYHGNYNSATNINSTNNGVSNGGSSELPPPNTPLPTDVASILARRIAVEYSDTEDTTGEGGSSSGGEWIEEDRNNE
ncbi:unnamed protein product [Gordionus sp. m RMFG-2023]|uniref:uncharacterized protein LOC135931351 n=1 Tax=Gordionus sp. m RMFG-2023 TaxID=3053472 RepID=UPI0030E5D5C6